LGNDRLKGDQNLVPFKKLNPFIAIAFGLKRNIHFLSLQRHFLGDFCWWEKAWICFFLRFFTLHPGKITMFTTVLGEYVSLLPSIEHAKSKKVGQQTT